MDLISVRSINDYKDIDELKQESVIKDDNLETKSIRSIKSHKTLKSNITSKSKMPILLYTNCTPQLRSKLKCKQTDEEWKEFMKPKSSLNAPLKANNK